MSVQDFSFFDLLFTLSQFGLRDRSTGVRGDFLLSFIELIVVHIGGMIPSPKRCKASMDPRGFFRAGGLVGSCADVGVTVGTANQQLTRQ